MNREMSHEEIRGELVLIRKEQEWLLSKVAKRRSWRESERAMAAMSYQRKIAALNACIKLVKEQAR